MVGSWYVYLDVVVLGACEDHILTVPRLVHREAHDGAQVAGQLPRRHKPAGATVAGQNTTSTLYSLNQPQLRRVAFHHTPTSDEDL